MISSMYGGSDLWAIKQALEATRLTHQEVSHNLSNMDTPGYVSHTTDFRSALLEARGEGAPAHGKPFEAYLEDVGQKSPGVNVEAELARLSQTSLDQSALVTLLNQNYSDLRSAIREGK